MIKVAVSTARVRQIRALRSTRAGVRSTAARASTGSAPPPPGQMDLATTAASWDSAA